MSNMNDNPLVHGARGQFGRKFVYRKRGNDTHLVRMPSVNKKRKRSAEEKARSARFKLAVLFAKGAIKSQTLKAQYDLMAPHNGNGFNMAIRDFMTPPTVELIDAVGYNGTAGSIISIIAEDDFRVIAAVVTIRTAAGDLLEKGHAILDPMNLAKWDYTATQVNPASAGSIISVVVRDVPGNTASKEITI